MSELSQLDKYFIFKTEKGFQSRGLTDKPGYQDRLNFELETIIKMGFPGYFLIVQDFINWAKDNDIYVGPGRGSAAGSLVSYCLGITNLDPIEWDLLFERFLNPARISMPDIDVDFEDRYRGRVIDYIASKYGPDKVAHIGTFGTMRAKAAVRSVCKTLGHPYKLGNDLANLLLEPVHGKPQPLATSIERVEELSEIARDGGDAGEVLRWAQNVENLIQSKSVHASGIVIADESLFDRVPLFRGRGGELTTQWEMYNIEEAGYIKFDFLGLDALTKMHIAVDLIRERHGIQIDIDDIPQDDEKTFAMLRNGQTCGVFQLEGSSGIKDLLVRIRPNSIEDLIATVAIYRPGPLDSDYMPHYLAVRAGEAEPTYLVPELEPILSRTDGWLIYQEQIMEICKQLCNYTGAEADDMRKAVGKKKQKMMDLHEPKFKKGWAEHGLDPEKAQEMWDDIVGFAAYGFNRSHAAAYAFVTYQTAYLKANYPHEYMTACMTVKQDDKDYIIKCIDECKSLGIKILPPDINTSQASFSLNEDNEILFGLGPIKGIKKAAIAVLEERDQYGKFRSLQDFCERVNMSTVNRAKLENFIRAGAFDQFGYNRASMLDAVENIWKYHSDTKAYERKMETFRKKEIACEERLEAIEKGELSPKGKKLKPLKTPTRPEAPVFPSIREMDELPDTEIHASEHELLGFFISSHPLDKFNRIILSQSLCTVEDLKDMANETKISCAVVMTKSKEISTKSKQPMAFVTLEDQTGSIEGVCFHTVWPKVKGKIQKSVPIRVDGIVNVTEAEEEGTINRISKIKITKMTPLAIGIKSAGRYPVSVPAQRANELAALLEKYSGNLHEVSIELKLRDGTKFRVPERYKIGNFSGALMREVARMNNESQ